MALLRNREVTLLGKTDGQDESPTYTVMYKDGQRENVRLNELHLTEEEHKNLTKQHGDSAMINVNKVDKIMATMQELTASVQRNTDVDESVLTLISGISTQLKDAQASNDPAAIQAVIDQLDANTKRMADAVTANTPAA